MFFFKILRNTPQKSNKKEISWNFLSGSDASVLEFGECEVAIHYYCF